MPTPHLEILWVELPSFGGVQRWHVHTTGNEAVPTLGSDLLKGALDTVKDVAEKPRAELNRERLQCIQSKGDLSDFGPAPPAQE